jgi:hypothetical protein
MAIIKEMTKVRRCRVLPSFLHPLAEICDKRRELLCRQWEVKFTFLPDINPYK